MVEISGIASKGSSIHQRNVRIFVFLGKADKKLSAFRVFFQKRTTGMHDGCNGWDERDGHYGCYNHYGRHRCYGTATDALRMVREGCSKG